jgi:15-cis-phytoene synthase/lycopene beta-cyclase
MIPTVFLWVVDTLSLGRGTWVIEKSTKLDIQVWGKLDLEYVVPEKDNRAALIGAGKRYSFFSAI